MLPLCITSLLVSLSSPRTFCNPINIAYRFSTLPYHDVFQSHREAADPAMVSHNGTYWLFASKLGGYYHSTDMNNWTLVVPTGLGPVGGHGTYVQCCRRLIIEHAIKG